MKDDTSAVVVWLVPMILFFVFLFAMFYNPIVPQFIIDSTAQRRNQDRYRTIEREITDLENQAKEIEKNIFREN